MPALQLRESVSVPNGNRAEFLREKAVLKCSAGELDCGVVVVVNPQNELSDAS